MAAAAAATEPSASLDHRVTLGLALLGAVWGPTIVLGDRPHLAIEIAINAVLTAAAIPLVRRRRHPRGQWLRRSPPRGYSALMRGSQRTTGGQR